MSREPRSTAPSFALHTSPSVRMKHISRLLFTTVGFMLVVLFAFHQVNGQIYRYAKQGYSMRLVFDNRGAFGRVAYPGVIGGGIDPGGDSIGLEYPIGSPHEHIFGAGIWVGGILDTAEIGTSSPLKLVTTGYEGWIGPYFEFNPGTSASDTIWKVNGRGVQRPPGWEAYWGNSIPEVSFSDNDHYCMYTDTRRQGIAGHVPLKLKVVQSSYVWSSSYAEAIHIKEYKIVNLGIKEVDSAYVGIFLNRASGSSPSYSEHYIAGYYPDIRMAYIHSLFNLSFTPVGVSVLHSSRPLDSLRSSFQWWRGPEHPNQDLTKYQLLSSGTIDSPSVGSINDWRVLLSIGPFSLQPGNNPPHDTLVVAVGVVSGQNLSAMRVHAQRAKLIYENGGAVPVSQGAGNVPDRFILYQNYPNPFNPATTIRFALPTSVRVQVIVSDVMGQEVTTLADRDLTAGEHSLVWDAGTVASGIYFYTVRAGEYFETRKLVLLR